MKIVTSISELAAVRREWEKDSFNVGLVPTMGALHDGHLSLIDQIRPSVDKVVVSIFVNPKQFGPNEDFEKYPRTFMEDRSLLEGKKVDLLFMPAAEEFYPKDFSNSISNIRFSNILCGAARPGHFDGVLTVVMKLFSVVKPRAAIFGKKDFQQLQLIKSMVKDFCLDILILEGPVVRETSGLAMSSRNRYLTDAERQKAAVIHRALKAIKNKVEQSIVRKDHLISMAAELITEKNSISIEYIEIRKPSLEPFDDEIRAPAVVLAAVKLGSVRLIDNLEIHE
ncbi:MAG: pantoate--beta-alanine ligase [Oligoflexales bacterium]